ncbi:16S rRNA (cytosine967-C5)-methyltransferase [Malonomonas rubra DSM 5091]|uniref:16S rRNA (cytosine(967)-C(5))-methyltransferase n=1 Tax=Malonomonas rubra DSM 5091 TaxID=1122189 RepID=A0A1M6HMI3_MALRU|nr:16S rRNA (cytosine(967)-C(5))-methyltransferase RsmB [Malonomonas rubra]SHJ23314.1 16S rRNA (cytosine967-C5)-methyltransferase [Malonomonas rubra DSM 5091]
MSSTPDDSPRRAAYEILLRVDEGAFADLVLDTVLTRSRLDGRDRGLVTELVYGVLRLRGRIDFALEQFCKQPLKRLQPEVLRLLRLGAYQLLELDRVPAHAAVGTSVELARELGHPQATGFINGVLRSLERGKEQIDWPQPENIRRYLQHVCSMPVWLTKELMRLLPNAEARALGEALALPAPHSLRVNTLKTDRAALLEQLAEAGHQARACRFAPEGIIIEKRGEGPLPGNVEGHYQVQDEASMLMAHLLDAQPGQRILDCCAAPGGKTTHIAALTENRAEIVALEKYPQRVELIEQGAKRLGCEMITAKEWDLTEPPQFLEEHSFDRILLDAPCSGLGVLRRNPESRWSKSAVNIRELAELQRELLFNAAPLVKPGGRLLYSLCSFSQLETDGVVAEFLEAHPQFELEDLRETCPSDWAELFTEKGTLRSYPHRHDDMDAFFAARFVRSQ